MKEKVFVIVDEWCIDYEGGVQIVGTFKDEEKAKDVFKDYVGSCARVDSVDHNFSIETDTDTEFTAYLDGEYSCNHISVTIRETTLE